MSEAGTNIYRKETCPCAKNEDIWGVGDIVPCILNLDTTGRYVVMFMPQPFYPQQKGSGTH
jgi:hypothetical protein